MAKMVDLRETFRCQCTKLGQGLDEPGRKRIDHPSGRFVTTLEGCQVCHGTGIPPKSPEERLEETRRRIQAGRRLPDNGDVTAYVANGGR